MTVLMLLDCVEEMVSTFASSLVKSLLLLRDTRKSLVSSQERRRVLVASSMVMELGSLTLARAHIEREMEILSTVKVSWMVLRL